MAAPLRRSLTLVQLTFYGVGTIVGAGIYSVLGAAAGMAGRAVWASLALASLAAFVTALSYAELISAFPRAGAEYQFLRHAFPGRRLPSFLAGYLIAFNAAATSATVAIAFAGYLRVFADVPGSLVALGLLVACTVLNVAGIRQSTWVGIALICVEVGGLLLMAGAGLLKGDPVQAVTWPASPDALAGMLAAAAVIFFIFIGFEDVANLAEEAREPRRDVPRALMASVAITSVLYLVVTVAVLGVVDPAQLAQSESPLTAAGNAVAPWLGNVLAVAALFATASTALISLVSISRMLFGMAREGDLPRALARTTTRRQTPWVAALVLFAAACAFLPLGEVKIVASLSACGVLMVFAGVQVATIVLRVRQPDLTRPFRVPGAIGRIPVLPVVGVLATLGLLTQFELRVYLITGSVVVAGVVLHRLLIARGQPAPTPR